MGRVLKSSMLVVLGFIVGAASMGLFAYRCAEKSARDGAYTDKLGSVMTSSNLLELLDAERLPAVRKVLEYDLTSSLQSADELAAAGATVPFYPAFVGDFQAGLVRAQSYATSHDFDSVVIQRAQRLQGRLRAGE